MKKRPENINRRTLVAGLVAAVLGVEPALAAEPHDSGGRKICGTLRSFQGELQVFDSSRTHLGEAAFGAPIRCGDWVSVDQGKATIEHVDGAALLVAENTFLQIMDPQSGANSEQAHVALYRGEFLVEATRSRVDIVTPNAVARVEKGSVYVMFATGREESQLIGLGGQGTLENRFYSGKKMPTDFAKFVSFSNPIERIVPEVARFVNARQLAERLAPLGVETSLIASLEKAVKEGSKIRMPASLAPIRKPTTVEGSGKFVAAQGAPLPPGFSNRAPASVALPAKKIKTHTPALKPTKGPDFALKREAMEKAEKARLLQALSAMDRDDE